MTGFLVINKPVGISSYDVIRHIKRVLKQKVKIGHAGTLDPLADGLLIVALGRLATKELSVFTKLPKRYKATGVLGVLTDSLDKEGAVLAEKPLPPINNNKDALMGAINALGSSYDQIPPIYAAVKYKGISLYKYARSAQIPLQDLQEIAAQKMRKVQLYQISLMAFEDPYFTVDMCVSSGTYVRSVLNDIAHHLDTYATTQVLSRCAVGSITLSNAISLEQLKTVDDITTALLSKEYMEEQFGISFKK